MYFRCKWDEQLYSMLREQKLPINRSHLREKLVEYHYSAMLDKLNAVDFGKIGSVGYLLRRLWEKYDCKQKCGKDCNTCKKKIIVFNTKINGQTHEQDMKKHNGKVRKKIKELEKESDLLDDEFDEIMKNQEDPESGKKLLKNEEDQEKKEAELNAKKKELLKSKAKTLKNGIYVDLLHDTYQKDWSKAYQYTFHECFHAIDWLSSPDEKDEKKEKFCFSAIYKNRYFRFVNPDGTIDWTFACDKEFQFGEVIIKDIENLKKQDFDDIHKLSKHEKAPLYDAFGGVLYRNIYPDMHNNPDQFANVKEEDREYNCFGHAGDYWLEYGTLGKVGESYVLEMGIEEQVEELRKFIKNYNVEELYGKEFQVDFHKSLRKHGMTVKNFFPEEQKIDTVFAEGSNEKEALEFFTELASIAYSVGGKTSEAGIFVNKFFKKFQYKIAVEVFADMTSTAIVNPKAFEAMRKYLPNSYRMFIEILNEMYIFGRK